VLAVTALLSDGFHSLWIGTEWAGRGRIRDGMLERVNTASGLTGIAISSIFEHRDGNIWTTTSEGIDCCRALPVVVQPLSATGSIVFGSCSGLVIVSP
jgi:ligand-binding sensor domain-containing protein